MILPSMANIGCARQPPAKSNVGNRVSSAGALCHHYALFDDTEATMTFSEPPDTSGGGYGAMIRFELAPSSLGQLLVAASGKGVCAVLFGDDETAQVADLQRRFPRTEILPGNAELNRIARQVAAIVEEPGTPIALPLDLRGTAFRRRVWQVLREIAPGTTASYAAVAARIGQPTAMRAVAQACGANNLAVVVPCHRVVRSDGALSGYHWGIDRKRELLAREARAAAMKDQSA
jgi:AraC family transcriptional regulator of adaptative response/methylated-DNA-[protein]-cysteine methyltransferase